MSSGVPYESTHIAAAPVPSSVTTRVGRRLCCLVALLGPALGGCAMSFPMASLLPSEGDVTGSNSPVPFGRVLNEEDRRRELAALATALDPQGDGATVKWDNTKSGNRGAIAAVGKAYTSDTKICRRFASELKQDGGSRKLEGTACTISAGEWKVIEAKAVKS